MHRFGSGNGVLSNSRGASMVLVAITMVALLSATALAIDIGMLLNARTEAQRAADAAALAGAGNLIVFPPDNYPDAEARAEDKAIEYGALNTVTDIPVTVLPEDVAVDLAQRRVTVTVRRIDARGNAVATWFARVFGVNEVDIEARAAAEAQPTGLARCVKPFTIPDYYFDVNENGEWDEGIDQYDPAVHGYGSSWRNPGQPGDDGLGYINDLGRRINIKEGGPGLAMPGWTQPWDIPHVDGSPAAGGNNYRENIAMCNPYTVAIGEEYLIENGNMWGPTVQGAERLMDLDPNAFWNPGNNEIESSVADPNWEASPRIGIVPTHHPGRVFDPGKKPIEFTNFIAMFFEYVEGHGQNQEVVVRVMYPTGVSGGGDVESNAASVVLVE